MIRTTDIENSLAFAISNIFKEKKEAIEIFINQTSKSRENTKTFIINVDEVVTNINKGYLFKKITAIIQCFKNDKKEFTNSFDDIKNILLYEIFNQSLPIFKLIKEKKQKVRHLLFNNIVFSVVDDILAIKLETSFTDDAPIKEKPYKIIKNLHLKGV